MANLPNKILRFWKTILAGTLVFAGVVVLSAVYGPLIKEEVRYQLSAKGKNTVVVGKVDQTEKNADQQNGINVMQPVDEDFGIVIPKISANAKVIADVDPNNSSEYQRALTEGVAQAQGSAYPGEGGNVFIFAHSGADFSQAVQFNAVFYLLSDLNIGDDIFLFHSGQKFQYAVKEKKIVSPQDVQYLQDATAGETVTLMTCWPAGTTLKRLVVIAQQIQAN